MGSVIRISDKDVRFARAILNPNFRSKRIISSTPWDFVSLWLRKEKQIEAQIYWNQARNFFEAAKNLPTESAPLPLYYSFLNAAKALLSAKGVAYQPYHGVVGFDMRTGPKPQILLDNEGLLIKNGGILPALISYFGESETLRKYTLGEVFANIACIHRAYSVSYNSNELFLSIDNPRYVSVPSRKARFEADLPLSHVHGQTVKTFPAEFEVRQLSEDEWSDCPLNESGYVLQTRDSFDWSGGRRPTSVDLSSLSSFHHQVRLFIQYISGSSPNWYLKRNLASIRSIRRNNLTLMFMAMHRASEISRYKPIELSRLLNGTKNWLFYEFIEAARNQFIDEIAAEITGFEISPAGVRQTMF
jgi:hypothetical protein